MESTRNIRIRWLRGILGETGHDVVHHFSRFVPGRWQPQINAFRCETELKICVDLAGVEKSAIDLRVEPRRVLIRGIRQMAEPPGQGCDTHVLALEIDYGPFEREIILPAEVAIEQTTAEQQNGLLWIHLPLKP